MANRDTYQLLEFQPRTCLLPGGKETNPVLPQASSTGRSIPETLPCPESAIPAHPEVRTVIQHRPSYTDPASMYPDRRTVHDYRNPGYEMDSFKQPAMPSPVYVLMPTQAAPVDYYPGRGADPGYGAPCSMDMARRRRPYYRDDEYMEHSYRRSQKGCCSCWRCAIACIILLAILGVGAAIAGIVFIKLIDDGVVGSNVGNFQNATSTTTMPIMSFDIEERSMESSPFSNLTIVRDTNDNVAVIAVDVTTASSVMETSGPSFPVIIDASGGKAHATDLSLLVTNTTEVGAPIQFDVGSSPSSPVVVNINVHLPNNTENASIDVLPLPGPSSHSTAADSSLGVATPLPTFDSATTLLGTVRLPTSTASLMAEETTSSTSASLILLSEEPMVTPSTHERTMPATPASGLGFSVNGMSVETSPMPAIAHMDATRNAVIALDNAEKLGMKIHRAHVAGIAQVDHLVRTTAEPQVMVAPLILVPTDGATTNSPSPSVWPTVAAGAAVDEANATSTTTTMAYVGAKIFHRIPT